MSVLKDKISELEAQLQALIEGSAAQLFPSNGLIEELTHRLTLAMQDGLKTQPDGQVIAPNLFTLIVHPKKSQELRVNTDLLDDLAQAIQEAGTKAGFVFLVLPSICIQEDPQIPLRDYLVTARIHLDDITQTTDVDVYAAAENSAIPTNTFMIVNGTRVFQLSNPVINIGRRPDNHLVIEDGRVSRLHAQLRAIKGRYMIFDLDSSGGTFVNHQRIHQSTLFPGDVISLAGVPLIYGQDEFDSGETQQYNPPTDNQS